ncbi:hypothetical protein H4Q26_000500 [Puccinia striiformis f. sp. tritici PST-130]|nr:hypothetical protein H4Q26_000500 [Puccinia striiformis f. sp. tritici PST-130]
MSFHTTTTTAIEAIEQADVDGDELDEESESLTKDIHHDLTENDELDSNQDIDHLPTLIEDDQEDEEQDIDTTHIKYSLHIEVRLRSNSTILYDTVRRSIGKYITDNYTTLETHTFIRGWEEHKFLINEVYSVYCSECAKPTRLVTISSVNLSIHVYELPIEGADKISKLCANPSSENGQDDDQDDDDEEEGVGDVAASRIELPANKYEGVWESLIYEEGLKIKLLNYIYSSIIFAEQNVNSNLISWHRLILLHGPPGTGKTSLCKALSQKVSIRLSGIYQKTELVEINSHSLFSKWFSESGKLVHSLFTKIEQIAENVDVFVLVLIDEVESLAGSRSSGATGSEPSDALRATLDKLRYYKNVLVLTTSNLTGSIDEAFLDRADIKQFIDLPSPEAVYWILRTCLQELIQTKIISPRKFLDYKEAVMVGDQLTDGSRARTDQATGDGKSKRSRQSSLRLLAVAEAASGMSGRSLRRLPLLAHARTAVARSSSGDHPILPIDLYLDGMLEVVREQKAGANSNHSHHFAPLLQKNDEFNQETLSDPGGTLDLLLPRGGCTAEQQEQQSIDYHQPSTGHLITLVFTPPGYANQQLQPSPHPYLSPSSTTSSTHNIYGSPVGSIHSQEEQQAEHEEGEEEGDPTLFVHQPARTVSPVQTSDTHLTMTSNHLQFNLSKPSPVFIPKTSQHLTPNIQTTHPSKEIKPALTSKKKKKKNKITINQSIRNLESNPEFTEFINHNFLLHLDDQFYLGFNTQSKFCKRCKIFKPPRSHHCRRCDACVLKMDHHCPWIGRCVGSHNYKFFLNFLQWSSIYCISIFVSITIKLINNQNDRTNENNSRESEILISTIIISGTFLIFISSLYSTHLYLILNGLTTLEHLSDRKFVTELADQIPTKFPITQEEESTNPKPMRSRIWGYFFRRESLNRSIIIPELPQKIILKNFLISNQFTTPAIEEPTNYLNNSLTPHSSKLYFYQYNWKEVMGRSWIAWILPIRPIFDHRHSHQSSHSA